MIKIGDIVTVKTLDNDFLYDVEVLSIPLIEGQLWSFKSITSSSIFYIKNYIWIKKFE